MVLAAGTADIIRESRAQVEASRRLHPMAASIVIYEGMAVGLDSSGNAVQLQNDTVFVGFAKEKVDNSAGAAGAKWIEVYGEGLREIDCDDIADRTDLGEPVFFVSSDAAGPAGSFGNKFGLTTGVATDDPRIGFVDEVLGADKCIVRYWSHLVLGIVKST